MVFRSAMSGAKREIPKRAASSSLPRPQCLEEALSGEGAGPRTKAQHLSTTRRVDVARNFLSLKKQANNDCTISFTMKQVSRLQKGLLLWGLVAVD